MISEAADSERPILVLLLAVSQRFLYPSPARPMVLAAVDRLHSRLMNILWPSPTPSSSIIHGDA